MGTLPLSRISFILLLAFRSKMPAEKEQLYLARRWAAVRTVRNFQLDLSDFESHKAFEGVASKNWLEIKQYRQMLRDIPQDHANDIDKAEAILGIQEP